MDRDMEVHSGANGPKAEAARPFGRRPLQLRGMVCTLYGQGSDPMANLGGNTSPRPRRYFLLGLFYLRYSDETM